MGEGQGIEKSYLFAFADFRPSSISGRYRQNLVNFGNENVVDVRKSISRILGECSIMVAGCRV
jgi:hypothetical protein